MNTFFYCRSFWLCKLAVSGFHFMSVCSQNVCVLVSKVTHLLKICKITFGYKTKKRRSMKLSESTVEGSLLLHAENDLTMTNVFQWKIICYLKSTLFQKQGIMAQKGNNSRQYCTVLRQIYNLRWVVPVFILRFYLWKDNTKKPAKSGSLTVSGNGVIFLPTLKNK